MKKTLLALSAVILLSAISNVAQAQNIAVVDVSAVVSKSAQVAALKKDQKAKMQELEKWLKNAQTDIEKQQTQKVIKKI